MLECTGAMHILVPVKRGKSKRQAESGEGRKKRDMEDEHLEGSFLRKISETSHIMDKPIAVSYQFSCLLKNRKGRGSVSRMSQVKR